MMQQDQQSDTILVALDGSPSAESAANVAIQVAHSQNLAIRGLYVVDETVVLQMYTNFEEELGYDGAPGSRAELVSWFEEQGSEALQWLNDRCQAENVLVTTDLLFGGVSELVREEVGQAAVLALGRRGHGHVADPTHLGYNFRAIAHHVHRPMLVGGDVERSVERVLLAYNGDEHAQRALAWTSSLQRTLSNQVVVLAVEEDPDANRDWLTGIKTQLDASGLVDYRLISQEGQPASEIVAAAAENEADLIVMGGYRHSALMEWLVGSTLDRVLRATPLPVLAA
jgi:nucleotide-binding universal stress UspA family protein